MAKPSLGLFFKSNKGFTLVEALVSIGIMSVILAGLATAVVNTVRDSEDQAKDAMNSMEDLAIQSAQQDYLTRAAPSYYFLHVPIRSFCAGSEKIPCLRQIDPATGNLTQVNAGTGFASTINFYRDVSGELKDTKLSGMSATGAINDEVHMMSGETLDVSRLTSQRNNSYVYASWPLFDESSEALPIMVRKNNAAILTHLKQYGASYENAAPAGISLFQLALATDKAQALANDLKDSMAVIYNINRPSQFVVQKITDATNCPQDSTTKSFCTTTGNSISPLATTPIEADGFNNVMALKIDNLQISKTFDNDGSAGSRTHLTSLYIPTSRSVNVQGSWFSSNGSNDFLFPRSSFSLFDERQGYQGDLSYSPVDVKRIQHYLNANNSDTSLVVLPVDLGYIKLKKSIQYPDKLDLVVTSASHQDLVLVPSIKLANDAETFIYINRRLATGIIEIFIK